MESISIVVPVYNDWTSFFILLDKLNEAAKSLPASLLVLAVDDGSTDPDSDPNPNQPPSARRWPSLHQVHIVQLATNMGHQRAIAIGLCVAVADHASDAVLVMDGDGEDPPSAIATLIRHAGQRKDFCVVAERKRRRESFTFRLFYLAYKSLFRLVTGKKMSFGNFSLTSHGYARRLVMIPDLWNNLAAALLRSRLPVDRVPIDRGQRYAGTSKMGFVALIVHGMSGISVYAETIYVRMLLLTVALVALTVLSIPILLAIRIFFPVHATPGWATTVSFGLIIIFLQVFLTGLSSILMILNNRVQQLVLPFRDYLPHVISKRRID